jgi:hypothetical protein
MNMSSTVLFGWSSQVDVSQAQQDTLLTRESAAVIQQGIDATAQNTPINQIYKAPDGLAGTGTNINGANLTIAAGRNTGSGAGGSLLFQTAPAGATGTAGGTLATRMTIDSTGNVGVNAATATNYIRFPWTTLAYTSTSNITVNLDAGSMFKLTLTNNAFFVAPSGLPGTNLAQTIQVHLLQDGTGGRTIMLTNSAWVVSGYGESTNATPSITTNANSISVLTFVTSPFNSKLYGVPTAFSP